MRSLCALVLILLAAACSDGPDAGAGAGGGEGGLIMARDPVVARALHDPLMSDPDLASRNDANAVLGLAASAAMPLFTATPAAARSARDAARLELLETGAIPDLPLASDQPGGKALGPLSSPADLLAALEAPGPCAALLEQGFAWSADLPAAAAIMPHGMVVQAGGAAQAPCRVRIVRYHTPAEPADVLAYHYARAVRAGMQAVRHAAPEASIAARGAAGERLVVQVRKGAHGMTAVDLLYHAS